MLAFAAKRILLLVPVLIGLSILLFAYVRVLPGDPVAAMLGVNADPELVQRLRSEYGLDKPIPEQYVTWVSDLVKGDLGVTFRSRQPIAPILVGRIPATLQLLFPALALTLLLALPAGLYAGMHPGSRADRVISTVTLLGLGTPSFWLGTLLVVVGAILLKALPSQGYVTFASDPGGSVRYTILPALTMGFAAAPYLARMTRASVSVVMRESYVAFADAKGLRESTIMWRHVARGALPSIVVVLGLTVGNFLAGSIFVEVLFSWPGVGRLLVGSVLERDYFLIQALILSYAIVFAIVNLLSELLQGLLDPRVRLT